MSIIGSGGLLVNPFKFSGGGLPSSNVVNKCKGEGCTHACAISTNCVT